MEPSSPCQGQSSALPWHCVFRIAALWYRRLTVLGSDVFFSTDWHVQGFHWPVEALKGLGFEFVRTEGCERGLGFCGAWRCLNLSVFLQSPALSTAMRISYPCICEIGNISVLCNNPQMKGLQCECGIFNKMSFCLFLNVWYENFFSANKAPIFFFFSKKYFWIWTLIKKELAAKLDYALPLSGDWWLV